MGDLLQFPRGGRDGKWIAEEIDRQIAAFMAARPGEPYIGLRREYVRKILGDIEFDPDDLWPAA